jgi:hypothetical protein
MVGIRDVVCEGAAQFMAQAEALQEMSGEVHQLPSASLHPNRRSTTASQVLLTYRWGTLWGFDLADQHWFNTGLISHTSPYANQYVTFGIRSDATALVIPGERTGVPSLLYLYSLAGVAAPPPGQWRVELQERAAMGRLGQLPADLLDMIVRRLGGRALAQLGACCKVLRRLTADDSLWERLCRACQLPHRTCCTWRETYGKYWAAHPSFSAMVHRSVGQVISKNDDHLSWGFSFSSRFSPISSLADSTGSAAEEESPPTEACHLGWSGCSWFAFSVCQSINESVNQ